MFGGDNCGQRDPLNIHSARDILMHCNIKSMTLAQQADWPYMFIISFLPEVIKVTVENKNKDINKDIKQQKKVLPLT